MGIGEFDMRHVPALQMADILAWSINAAHGHRIVADWQAAILDIPRDRDWLDEERLKRMDPQTLDKVKQLKLPTRRAMR